MVLTVSISDEHADPESVGGNRQRLVQPEDLSGIDVLQFLMAEVFAHCAVERCFR